MGRPWVIGRRSESGQALLISVGILLVLLISIPVIIFVSQTGISHQTRTQRQVEGRGVAEEGIAYASQLFASNQAAWSAALLTNNISGVAGLSDCNSGANVTGTQFRLTCGNLFGDHTSSFPGIQSYQIGIIATAWLPGPNGQLMPGSSLQMILSQKTMGAYLANGLRAGAALSLLKVPLLNALTVHWGPIVCYDTNPWPLAPPLDTITELAPATYQGYPRKFANGGITGASPFLRTPNAPTAGASAATSDQKEYWAFAALSSAQTIDDGAYILKASGPPPPPVMPQIYYFNGPCGAFPPGQASINNNTGIYDVPAGCTARLDDTFISPSNGAIIYIHGDAEFDNLQLDLGGGGAVIVTGILTLNNPGSGLPLTAAPFNIPLTAPQEYAYWPPPATPQWPCRTQYNTAVNYRPPVSPTCTSFNTGLNVNYRGFLWAKGGLVVAQNGWVMAGAIMVGDPLTAPAAALSGTGSLTLFYDAIVNQTILTAAH